MGSGKTLRHLPVLIISVRGRCHLILYASSHLLLRRDLWRHSQWSANNPQSRLGRTDYAARSFRAQPLLPAARSAFDFTRCPQVSFMIHSLPPANSHAILWIGVMYERGYGHKRSLDASSLDAALSAYDVGDRDGRHAGSEQCRRALLEGSLVNERDRIKWRRLVGWPRAAACPHTLRAGDIVRLVFLPIRRELRVYCIKPAGGMQGLGEDSPIATIRRLVPTRMYGAPYDGVTPPLHAIVHLTDVAVPNVAASASAVVEVLN